MTMWTDRLTAMTAEDLFVNDCHDRQTVEAVRERLPQLYTVATLACDTPYSTLITVINRAFRRSSKHIEQLAGRSMVISMLIRRADGL